MKLSKNLSVWEVACQCGCGYGDTFGQLDPALVTAFQVLRDTLGVPLDINSGCRCFAHNRAIGGSLGSQHLRGRALDLSSGFVSPDEIAEAARLIPTFYNGGLGLYNTFTHVDTGPKRRWDRRS